MSTVNYHTKPPMTESTRFSRRDVLRFTATASIVAPFAQGLGISAANGGDGRSVIMGVGGTWGAAVKQLIGERFEKQYGIPMALDSRPNAQQVAAIPAMRGKPK